MMTGSVFEDGVLVVIAPSTSPSSCRVSDCCSCVCVFSTGVVSSGTVSGVCACEDDGVAVLTLGAVVCCFGALFPTVPFDVVTAGVLGVGVGVETVGFVTEIVVPAVEPFHVFVPALAICELLPKVSEAVPCAVVVNTSVPTFVEPVTVVPGAVYRETVALPPPQVAVMPFGKPLVAVSTPLQDNFDAS